MTRGYMIRQDQAMAARADAACPNCGHRQGEHRQLPRELLDVVGGQLVTAPNPAYRPLHFHCDVDGCDCVQVLS